MKHVWKRPTLEVLDVSETMKGWPGKGDEVGAEPEDPGFDS